MNHKMEFPKLRLVGYYTGKTQNMYEESKYVTEAVSLAQLLAKSFATLNPEGICNEKFKEAFYGNTVFIFEDSEKRLYAYYPQKEIARLSSVIFRRGGNRAPNEAQAWFKPGEIWTIQYSGTTEYSNIRSRHTNREKYSLFTFIVSYFKRLFKKGR